jgi:hypothetical protein
MDIVTAAGAVRVKAGARGMAKTGIDPSRSDQFNHVPVDWGGRRLLWVKPSEVRAADGGSVDEWVVRRSEEHPVVWVPECDEDVDYHFGFNLRSIRRSRGMSQHKLVDKMGGEWSQTSISNWERNKSGPGGDFVVAAARALRVPAYAFYLPLSCDQLKSEIKRFDTLSRVICGGRNGIY